jgi:hypothetical protein
MGVAKSQQPARRSGLAQGEFVSVFTFNRQGDRFPNPTNEIASDSLARSHISPLKNSICGSGSPLRSPPGTLAALCETMSTHEKRKLMTTQSRIAKVNSDELPADVTDLVSLLDRLPENHRQAVEQAISRVIDSTRRRRRILTLVQDALGQLRLDMKYLMFDLEATRRERDAYRRQAEET